MAAAVAKADYCPMAAANPVLCSLPCILRFIGYTRVILGHASLACECSPNFILAILALLLLQKAEIFIINLTFQDLQLVGLMSIYKPTRA
jgi:hypothetical protein